MGHESAAGLKDPPTGRPIRKRTKLNHTSGVLHDRLHNLKSPAGKEHKVIEGQTKVKLHDGTWKTVNMSTFAGWYTPKFCKNVIDAFEEEFRLEDAAANETPIFVKKAAPTYPVVAPPSAQKRRFTILKQPVRNVRDVRGSRFHYS